MPEVDPHSLQGKPPEEAFYGGAAEQRGDDTESPTRSNRRGQREPKGIFVCCDGTGNELRRGTRLTATRML